MALSKMSIRVLTSEGKDVKEYTSRKYTFYIMGFLVFTSPEKIYEGKDSNGGNFEILVNFREGFHIS